MLDAIKLIKAAQEQASSELDQENQGLLEYYRTQLSQTFESSPSDYLLYPCSGYDAAGVLFAPAAPVAIFVSENKGGNFIPPNPDATLNIQNAIASAYGDSLSFLGAELSDFSKLNELRAQGRIWPALVGKLLNLGDVEIKSICPIALTDAGTITELAMDVDDTAHFQINYSLNGKDKTLIYLSHSFSTDDNTASDPKFNRFIKNIPSLYGMNGTVLFKAIPDNRIRNNQEFIDTVGSLPATFISDVPSEYDIPPGFEKEKGGKEIDIKSLASIVEQNTNGIYQFCHEDKMYQVKGPLDIKNSAEKTDERSHHLEKQDLISLDTSDTLKETAEFNRILRKHFAADDFFNLDTQSQTSARLRSTEKVKKIVNALKSKGIIDVVIDGKDRFPQNQNYHHIKIYMCNVNKLDEALSFEIKNTTTTATAAAMITSGAAKAIASSAATSTIDNEQGSGFRKKL